MFIHLPNLALFVISVLVTMPAMALEFQTDVCSSTEKINDPELVKKFSLALRKKFDLIYEISQQSIAEHRKCLLNADLENPSLDHLGEDCYITVKYYSQTIPLEWQNYRKSLALSRWSPSFGSGLFEDDVYFDKNLTENPTSWILEEKLEPLSEDEILKAQKLFNIFYQAIRSGQIKKIEALLHDEKSNLNNFYNVYEYVVKTLKSQDVSLETIYSSRDPYIHSVAKEVENKIFNLNRKRVIEHLSSHPILGLLRKIIVDKEALLEALSAMQRNLDISKEHIDNALTSYKRKYKSIESIPKDHPLSRGTKLTYANSRLFPLLDYPSIIYSTLSEAPEFCGVALALENQYLESQIFELGATFTANIAAFVVAGPLVGTAALAASQVLSISDLSNEVRLIQIHAFSAPLAETLVKDYKEGFIKKSELDAQIMVSPLILAGYPILRFNKILSFLK